MNMFERRQQVEQLLQAALSDSPDSEKRRVLWEAIDEARRQGTREMVLVATAATIAAGGKFTVPAALFAKIPTGGGLEMITRPDTGELIVQIAEQFSPLVHMLGALGGGLVNHTFEPPPAADPAADYPAANLQEGEPEARARICEAIKLLVDRYYRGEFETRGLGFVSTVFGELVAMALGIERAHEADPKPIEQWLEEFLKDLAPQVERYQRTAESFRQLGGEQRPETRLH